jgi:hypothetical protein
MDISDCMLQGPSKSLHKLVQKKNIGLATAHNVLSNKIKQVQACTDARGHHFKHLL